MLLTRKDLVKHNRINIWIWIISIILFSAYCQEDDNNLGALSCLYRKRGFIWDIGNLTSPDDYVVYDTSGDNSVVFNVCRKVEEWGNDSVAVLNKDGECHPLTSQPKPDNTQLENHGPNANIIEEDSLELMYNSTDSVWTKDTSRNFSFQLKLLCAKEFGNQEWMHKVEDPCTITIQWETPHGCPIIKVNALWSFVDRYREFLAPALLLAGFFFLFLGGYFAKVSIFIVIFSTVVFFVTAISYAFIISYKAEDWLGWIILPSAAILGAIVAFFVSTFIKIGVILIGLWTGAIMGLVLFQSLIHLITTEVWMLWTLMTVCAILCWVISIKIYNLVMILGTSLIGAFLFIRGIGLLAGGYPNEFQLHNDIISGDIKNMPWTAYVYMIAMVIWAILSALWKFKRLRLHKKRRESYDGYYDINP